MTGRREARAYFALMFDDCLPPALMLAGYALENYAKALVISRHPELAQSDGVADVLTRGHPLVRLLGDTDVSLSSEERSVVNRLEVFVKWAGRYRVPKKFEEMVPIAADGTKSFEPNDDGRRQDWEVMARLPDRLESLFKRRP